MRCLYCKKKCEPNPSSSAEHNAWQCRRCIQNVVVGYKTEMRDDTPVGIDLTMRMKILDEEKQYVVRMDLLKKTTVIQDVWTGELLANFKYVMKINPKIARDKLKTVLTFS